MGVTDVSALVAQMQETLAAIHSTLATLDPTPHNVKLDELEKKRDDAIQALAAAFSAESDFLARKRKAERDEIAERRRREDEERERRRREEDEALAMRDRQEDDARDGRLKEHTKQVELETDSLMTQAEDQARMAIEEGRERLRALQAKRRELNRLIEEQLELALPTILPVALTRARRPTITSPTLPTDTKPSETSRDIEAPGHADDGYDGHKTPRQAQSPSPQDISEASRPVHEPEQLATSAGQEVQPNDVGSRRSSDHGHGEPFDPESVAHGASDHDPSEHKHAGSMKPVLSQEDARSHEDQGFVTEPEREEEHGERLEHKEPASQTSPLHAHFRVDSTSPEPACDNDDDDDDDDDHPEDNETDTDSPDFVTPLPSQETPAGSLRQDSIDSGPGYVESQDPAVGQFAQHHEALGPQQATTVQGGDDLFDDDDRSEDLHVPPRDSDTGDAYASPHGARPTGTEQTAKERVANRGTVRRIPELTIEVPTYPEQFARSRSLAEEMESYFDRSGEPQAWPGSPPPLPPHELVRGAVLQEDSRQTEVPQESPGGRGLAASRHHNNSEQPETPSSELESLISSSEYVTPEASSAQRDDATNVLWRGNDGWTPQSQRTISTVSSPPSPSPWPFDTAKPEPASGSHVLAATTSITESSPYHSHQGQDTGRQHPFGDEADNKTPVSLTAPWQRRDFSEPSLGATGGRTDGLDNGPESPTSGGSNTGGGLFKRMRSIFEPPRSRPASPTRDHHHHHHRPSSFPTRPSSGAWFSDRTRQQQQQQQQQQRRGGGDAEMQSPTRERFPSFISSPPTSPLSPRARHN
ncbi:uncharacterized protein B0T15DRAFT_138922 [Chaetomium strumarium]|uniref:Uncharacterized protein n=1 Tax=Chaetomium strumarium TaxID=1170767 RepID=A0AAJ0GUH5_9PEZI|nr:hypothetical protein B0T15DRAFT_138922 [Chaetomium strumarium]